LVSPAVVVFVYHRGRSLLVTALFTGTDLPTLVGLAGKGQEEENPGWKQPSPEPQRDCHSFLSSLFTATDLPTLVGLDGKGWMEEHLGLRLFTVPRRETTTP